MFVYVLIYNFNLIKARHFSTDKWKGDHAQQSHPPCSRAFGRRPKLPEWDTALTKGHVLCADQKKKKKRKEEKKN